MSAALDLQDSLLEQERLKNLEEDSLLNDIHSTLMERERVKLRAVLFEVIDDGDPTIDGKPWALFHAFEPIADEARTRFIETVMQKLSR